LSSSHNYIHMYLRIYTFCVSDWPIPERKSNNNDDRHIKKRENKSYCQFFLPIPPSLSVPPFLLFRGNSIKKNRGEKKKEAAYRPTSLSATPSYAKLSPSCFAIRSLTYIHIYKYIDCVFFVVVKILLL